MKRGRAHRTRGKRLGLTTATAALLLGACGGGTSSTGDGDATSTDATTSASQGDTAAEETTDETESTEGGNNGLGALCDPFAQDCLPGLKCTMRYDEAQQLAPACVEVTGDATVGDPCEHEGFQTGNDTCDANSACIGLVSITGGWTGTCGELCGGTLDAPTCSDSDYVCGGGQLPVCFQRCDPLLQDCEGEGESCYLNNDTATFQCIALAETKAGLGETCNFAISCDPGLMCRDGSTLPDCSANCCAELCDVNGEACTLADQGVECVSLGADDPEFQNVGICVFP